MSVYECERLDRRRKLSLDGLPRVSPTGGFTLIEIIVVVIILGLLVGLVGPEIIGRVDESRVETARAQIEMLATQLDLYRLDNGSYPTTEQGLAALWEKPSIEPVPRDWRGPYSRKPVPLDPWGRAYRYSYPGAENRASYDLASYGADGQPGGAEEAADIVSWER